MALRAACSAALVAFGAAAQQDGTILLQSSASTVDELAFLHSGEEVAVDFKAGSFGILPEGAPAWCKDDSQLTWKQRRERMQEHVTLEWAKKAVKQMLEQNETVPEWMDKIVSDDEKRGKAKWAVAESKRMKAEGKETPKWMDEIVEEDARWANRWAACKAAELQHAKEEVPQWMLENGRKGILEAASEKAAELQEEIDEMEKEKDKDEALVNAQGDVQTANERMLAKSREFKARTVSSQLRVLEGALEELDRAEADVQQSAGTAKGPNRKYKQALRKAEAASKLLTKLLERKASMLSAQMAAAAQ
ncbi:unnamed protein product [Prorocentrum cordatum]|uniref:Uncharacterized protein n=2 Tax=Prorocentrum cordatum TaxID=2364126 RepID=A0ABN9SIF7_9DINO|nr:unnamed protein product [Polarella glacialis]